MFPDPCGSHRPRRWRGTGDDTRDGAGSDGAVSLADLRLVHLVHRDRRVAVSRQPLGTRIAHCRPGAAGLNAAKIAAIVSQTTPSLTRDEGAAMRCDNSLIGCGNSLSGFTASLFG